LGLAGGLSLCSAYAPLLLRLRSLCGALAVALGAPAQRPAEAQV
jgi:hypothetical protein